MLHRPGANGGSHIVTGTRIVNHLVELLHVSD